MASKKWCFLGTNGLREKLKRRSSSTCHCATVKCSMAWLCNDIDQFARHSNLKRTNFGHNFFEWRFFDDFIFDSFWLTWTIAWLQLLDKDFECLFWKHQHLLMFDNTCGGAPVPPKNFRNYRIATILWHMHSSNGGETQGESETCTISMKIFINQSDRR